MTTITSIFLCFAFAIPSIGTTSPLYTTKTDLAHRQAVVDAENSALYMDYGKGHAICDHTGSEVGGIWDMYDVHVGDIGILYTEDEAHYYVCTAIVKCKRGKTSYNWQGKPFLPDKDDIICFSCVDSSGDEEWGVYFDYCFSAD